MNKDRMRSGLGAVLAGSAALSTPAQKGKEDEVAPPENVRASQEKPERKARETRPFNYNMPVDLYERYKYLSDHDLIKRSESLTQVITDALTEQLEKIERREGVLK